MSNPLHLANITVRELDSDELPLILPLVEEWNAKVPPATLAARLEEMKAAGYRCVAAFDQGRVIGVGGFWVGCRLWCGRYIDLDNMIVDEAYRSQGIGNQIAAWIENEGKRLNCDVAVLDSYVTLDRAHVFYERRGYERLGYHFVKRLK